MSTGVVLAGLPATGKTSYLALLFHAIVEDRADGLVLGRFDDDREYITEISDVLLASNVADHTAVDDEQHVSLSLVYQGVPFVLKIPDLSGETWEHALVDRRWSTSIAQEVAEAQGFLVFVHCTEINDGLTLAEAETAGAAFTGEEDESVTSTTAAPAEGDESLVAEAAPAVVEADVSDTDDDEYIEDEDEDEDEGDEHHYKQLTQVSLVELLQFFAAANEHPIRVSLIISAWDLEPHNVQPRQWLAKNAPMLSQFLEVNSDEVEAAVWGVSAQGADLSDPDIRAEYKDRDPIDRARIHAGDGTEAGVAAPLRWVLRLDQ